MKIPITILLLTLVACNSNSSKPTVKKVNMQNEKVVNENPVIEKTVIDNSIKYDTYCNGRYDYCIEYPNGIIFPQPESQNLDGRVFKNKQGENILTVFGRMNSDPDYGKISLEQQFEDDLQGVSENNGNKDRIITYQKLGKTFFVISGLKKGRIFYQKTILKDDAFAYAILEYSENDKEIFDKVSTQLFKSFK